MRSLSRIVVMAPAAIGATGLLGPEVAPAHLIVPVSGAAPREARVATFMSASEVASTIAAGDMVIIPEGVAHGFSEISETITYLVIRVDSEQLVELKPK